MAVVNSYLASPLQGPFSAAEKDIYITVTYDIDSAGSQQQRRLSRAKSAESLTSLLTGLPDIVIPETLHNPLPLQCLAAASLPETVREEIDKVLDQYSVMATSPRSLETSTSGTSTAMSSSNAAFSDSATRSSGDVELSRGNQVASSEEEAVVESSGGSSKEVSAFFLLLLLSLSFDPCERSM